MTFYVKRGPSSYNEEINHSDDELQHHGILGMKWGVRRYQNPDGTFTNAGRKRIDSLRRKRQKIIDYLRRKGQKRIDFLRRKTGIKFDPRTDYSNDGSWLMQQHLQQVRMNNQNEMLNNTRHFMNQFNNMSSNMFMQQHVFNTM